MRPVALLALCESEENVKFLMDTTINTETQILQSTGVQLKEGKVNVNITRCLFDTKMAAILDGAGGKACHLCTCTRNQMKDIELIKQGIPINSSIDSAIEIFAEID